MHYGRAQFCEKEKRSEAGLAVLRAYMKERDPSSPLGAISPCSYLLILYPVQEFI